MILFQMFQSTAVLPNPTSSLLCNAAEPWTASGIYSLNYCTCIFEFNPTNSHVLKTPVLSNNRDTPKEFFSKNLKSLLILAGLWATVD